MNIRRTLKISLLAGTLVGTAAALHKNQWDISSCGLLRFGRAASTVATISVDYKYTLRNVDHSSEEYRKLISEVHLRSAKKLLNLCSVNGGVFIKVGQHLGAMDYLLPEEYVSTLSILHSKAPKFKLEDVFHVVQEDLGAKPSEIFSSFDPEPLGTASLAQVHKATLLEGQEVAVKVQHRMVKAHSVIDMTTMEVLVNIVAWLFPEFTFLWLAEETKRNLPLELDFVHEGKNADRVRSMFSYLPWLKIPKIYWNLTSSRVLVMEFCSGGEVNNKDYLEKNNLSPQEVSNRLGKLYSEMIFVQGYVHCDPHPGNLLVRKSPHGPELTLLDHGLYITLTQDFRITYCNFWNSLLNADLKGMKNYAEKLGVGELFGILACMLTARSWTAVQKGIGRQRITSEERKEVKGQFTEYLHQIAAVLNRVPREMLLIFKTQDLLRGIESTLGVRGTRASFISMSRSCTEVLFKNKIDLCPTYWCKFKLKLNQKLQDLRITFLYFFLWFTNTRFGSWLH